VECAPIGSDHFSPMKNPTLTPILLGLGSLSLVAAVLSAASTEGPQDRKPSKTPEDQAVRVNGTNVAGDNARPGTRPLAEIQAFLADADNHRTLDVNNPKDLWVPTGVDREYLASRIPAQNPLTKAKIELGRQLYFDPRLSKDLTVSCATCHNPAKGWTDHQPTSTGIGGQHGGRSAPTVFNRVLAPTGVQFWDGRAASLEEQSLGPIGNPIEMGFSVAEAASRLNAIPGYKMQFEKVFGGEANGERISMAIASFERTVLAGGAPEDYFAAAEPFRGAADPEETAEEKARRERILAEEKAHPFSEAALRGRNLYFGKAQCNLCHVGPNFSDESFHNLGIGATGTDTLKDKGREDHTKQEADRGKFRTPTARNSRDTAPFMHDGSLLSLKEVVEHYNKGGNPNRWLSKEKLRPLGLTPQEVADVVAYLEQGLQGDVTKVEVPTLP